MTPNRDGTITISGIQFDNPLDNIPLYQRTLTSRKEGERTTITSMWLDRYDRDFKRNEAYCESYCLEMTNRGVCTLDGNQLKDKTDIEKVKEIFAALTARK